MAVTVNITGVIHNLETGYWYVNFADGAQMEFQSREALQRVGVELDTDQEGVQTARKMLIRWWLARDPDADTPEIIQGKALTFDLWAPNPVIVI